MQGILLNYNYDTTNLLSVKQTSESLIAMLYLAAQKNIMHAPMYGIEFDPKAINLSKVNLCKNATNGCVTACIYHNGLFQNSHFSKNRIKQARLKRTMKFLLQKELFFEKLIKEIKSLQRKAKKNNLKLAIQLNKTSDILWEKESFTYKEKDYKNIMELFEEVNFFDYTKYDILKNRKKLPKNYELTYSRAGKNKGKLVETWEDIKALLEKNISVAIVCSKEIKETLLEDKNHESFYVINGDENENRSLDKTFNLSTQGSLVTLEAKKGTNINSNSAFVIETMDDLHNYLM